MDEDWFRTYAKKRKAIGSRQIILEVNAGGVLDTDEIKEIEEDVWECSSWDEAVQYLVNRTSFSYTTCARWMFFLFKRASTKRYV